MGSKVSPSAFASKKSGSPADDDDIPLRGNILVPTDFSAESDYALRHAVRFARRFGRQVTLLHVAGEDSSPTVVETQLQQQLEHLPERYSPLRYIYTTGDLERTVPEVALELGSEFIVLGSHSLKSPDLLKKSLTQRILRHGHTPYVIVQHPPKDEDVERVVFPIDYTDQNRGKYEWLARLHRDYEPVFHLVTPDVNEVQLQQQVQRNMARAMDFIQELGAAHAFYEVEGDNEFALEILEYAHRIDADMLVITSTVDPRDPTRYMLEPHERSLIIGAGEIPVMIVNPREQGEG